jgi:hypothetical protein
MRITIDIHEEGQTPQVEVSQSQEATSAIDGGGPPPELLSGLAGEPVAKESEDKLEEQPAGSPPEWLLQALENDVVSESSPLRGIPIEERFAQGEEGFAPSEDMASGGAAPEE